MVEIQSSKREAVMTRVLFFAVLLAATLLAAAPAASVINPHYDENTCGSCHLSEPEQGADGEMDYHFLGEDIDPTCNICHEKKCCTIAAPHESTHLSGTDRWDEEKYGTPEDLPLFDGYITCATCHFWRRANNPSEQDYKLLRLVKVEDTKINWAGLCLDCHKEY